MSALLVRGIGTLCTCDPSRGPAPGIIEAAALVAREREIVFVGREADLDRDHLPPDTVEVDARGSAVLPGFVDSHTHIAWLGERSAEYAQRAAGDTYADIAAAGGGIKATVRATATGSVEELAAAARERARRMLHGGTTTVEIKSGYGMDEAAEMRSLDAALRLRGQSGLPDVVTTYLPLHAAPDADREAFIDAVCASGVAAAGSRARFTDAYCERGAYSVAECERVLGAARSGGMGVKLHAEQLSRSGGALLAARLGATSADHLEHADDTDLAALARAAVVGVLLPGAALVLGGPPPPGRRLLDAGATVAIATDCNPGTCYSESMPLMISLAVATAGLTPAAALVAATAGGAAALGLSDRGVLRAGARCDAVILDTPAWLDVGYHLGGNVVRTVIREGRVFAAGA